LFDFNVSRNYLSLKPVVVSSIQNNYDWYKVSQCFVADGSEHFLVIGNFRNDANTETAGTGKLNPNFPAGLIANYAIDNVVLTSMDIPIGDTALCLGDTLRLDVGKPFLPDLKYQWQDGSTAPIFKISEAKHVVLQMHYSMQCGVSRSFDVVSYNTSTQRLSTKIDTFYCQGQSIELSGGLHLSGQRLLWEDGTSRDIRTVRAPGVYIATVKADCGLMLTKQYTIKAEICNPPIYIPNVFTPNGDGINDVFKPLLSQDFPFIETLTLSIFNRWGDLIFVTHDIDAGWDGRKGGDKFPSGVYIYSLVIKTTNSGNSLIVKNGDVTLIDR
jgi:gliding motility-associated-like protein